MLPGRNLCAQGRSWSSAISPSTISSRRSCSQKHGKKVRYHGALPRRRSGSWRWRTPTPLDALRQLKVKLDSDKARNQEALTALKEALEMERVPLRIEAYDISHVQGVETVGAMVVLYAGAQKVGLPLHHQNLGLIRTTSPRI